jgi:hypothetical protein
MPGRAGTLEVLAQQVGTALQPLGTRLAPANVVALFAELGLQFPPQLLQAPLLPALTSASSAATVMSGTLLQLATHIQNDNVAGIIADGVQLVQQIRTLVNSLPQIGTALGSLAGALPGMNPAEVTAFANNLPANLLSHMLISHLELQQPGILAILNLLAVVSYRPDVGIIDDPTHPAFVERKLQLSNLGAALTSPQALLLSKYNWGSPTFDGALLLPVISASLNLLDINSDFDPSSVPPTITSGLLSVTPNAATHGLKATLQADLPVNLNVTSPLSPLWALHAQIQGAFNAGLQTLIVPPAKLTLKPSDGTLAGLIEVDLVARGKDADHPIILIGQADGSRVQADSIVAGIGLPVKWDPVAASASAEPTLQLAMTGAKAIIGTSGADSFIASILSGLSLEAAFDLGLTYSITDGIRFNGSATLDIELASHVSLGPIAVNALTLSVGIQDQAFPLGITADLQASLGPLLATVKGLGFRIDVTLVSDNKGNLGPINVPLPVFQAPTGVGLQIDGGGFRGGGSLGFDPRKGEYFGTLELTFTEVISVRAVGILTTRTPDGQDTFSLILIIVSDFVPIQLSYGFTLLGVGGLLGLNRAVDSDALGLGVRDGTLDSILFPTDVIANAPRIVSDLKRVFPTHDGQFLMGPMAKLGWGTPTLVSVEVGLILQLPIPSFTILGVVRVQLPAEEFGTIYIQVNFAGGVDFEKGQLWFDASLYNSRVMINPITGDMVLRVYWGGEPNFLLSVGGFHPAYTPPPMNIPALDRLSVLIVTGIPSVTAEVYLAITSNTVQFGALVDVMYGVSFFNVFGRVGLDVLIQFNPFMFVAEISAMFGVRSGSDILFAISVTATLKGPTPWNVRGEASFEIGFIIKVRLSADFEVTSGESRNTLLPTIDVIGQIRTAIDNVGNWRAVLPPNSNQHVSLRELSQNGVALVLHPFGTLEISQKIAPLNIAIQRFGSSRPDRGSIFRISAVKINSATVSTSATAEQFAPAQFFDLSDAEKLSRPSFAYYDSGLTIGADDAPQTDFQRERDVQYEPPIYLPEPQPVRLFFKLATSLFTAFARGNSTAQSSLSQQTRAVSALAAAPASLAREQYAVVSTLDMTLHAAPLVFESATAADQAIAALIAAKPELTGAIQVVPAAQMRRAA